MLTGKLFTINTIDLLQLNKENAYFSKYSVTLALNCHHDIFNGHFPGNPVLPGVCQVEMIRELAEKILGLRLLLSQASHVKFLSLINPLISPVLCLNLTLGESGRNEFDVSAEVTSVESVCMKMKGQFKEFKT